jgi:hypothetical protein
MSDWNLHFAEITEHAKPYSQILAWWTLFFSIPSLLLTFSILVILIIKWKNQGYLNLNEQLSVVLMIFDFFSAFSMNLIGVFNLTTRKIIIEDELRCKFFTLLFIFCFHNSIYLTCFIGFDRYRKITTNRYIRSNTKFYILMVIVFGSHLILDLLGFFFGKFSIQKAGCYCLPDPNNNMSKVIIVDIFIKGTLTLIITSFCYIAICKKKCQASLVTAGNNEEFGSLTVKDIILNSPSNRKVVYRSFIICGFYTLSYILMVVNALSELITGESRPRELDFFSYILMSSNPMINTIILLNLNTNLRDRFFNTYWFLKRNSQSERYY